MQGCPCPCVPRRGHPQQVIKSLFGHHVLNGDLLGRDVLDKDVLRGDIMSTQGHPVLNWDTPSGAGISAILYRHLLFIKAETNSYDNYNIPSSLSASRVSLLCFMIVFTELLNNGVLFLCSCYLLSL